MYEEEERIAWYKVHRELTKKLIKIGIIQKKSVREVHTSQIKADMRKISIHKETKGIPREEVEKAVEAYLKKGGQIKVLKPVNVITGDPNNFIEDDEDRDSYLQSVTMHKYLDGLFKE
jgi:hypothetical protein